MMSSRRSWKEPSGSIKPQLKLPFASRRYSYDKSMPKSHLTKIQDESHEEKRDCQIYFDHKKKTNYMKGIIDTYFQSKTHEKYHMIIPQLQPNTVRNNKPISLFSSNRTKKAILQTKDSLSQSANDFYEKPEQSLLGFIEQLQVSSFPHSYPPPRSLPPIHQVDDKQDIITDPPAFLSHHISSITEINPQQKESRNFVFENAAFAVSIVSLNGKPNYRLKQFKSSGLEILRRENRVMEKYKSQIITIWKNSKYNQMALMSSIIPPIKELLSKMTVDWQSKSIIYKIVPKSYQKYLMANNNAELLNFIRDVCLLLKKIEGNVLNNKVNPSNIFLVDGKPCFGEWGHSAFREQWNIQSNTFQSRLDPVLRSQAEWFATPQYLSPELIKQMTEERPDDLWEYPASSDIWSLGCTIFEIVTCIPMWSSNKCVVKGKPKTARSGLLGVQNRDLQKVMDKQKKLQRAMKKCLTVQLGPDELNEKIASLILRMVEVNPQKRVTLNEILQQLN